MSSNLMPGYNDDYYDRPCAVCEKHPEDCECPECPKCGFTGNPDCYDFHGLATAEAYDINDCPLCEDPHRGWLVQPKGDKAFVFCPSCGLRGPSSLSAEFAIKDWNSLPRRPGPQTKAVLAEVVELLTDPSVGPLTPGIKHVMVDVDREAFLKEQGVS